MRLQILSDQENAALVSCLFNYPLRDNCIIRLMLQCGLRVGEVVGLDITNVYRFDFVNNTIFIPVGTVKGHNPRHVDIPAPLKALLSEYIKSILDAEPELNIHGPLFRSTNRHMRLSTRDVQRTLSRISFACLGRRVNPHQLRHTYATILMKHTNIRVVQQLLGHSSLASTQIYTHVSSEDCRLAVNQAFSQ